MPDLRHGSFQVAAFSLKVEIGRRTEPDALGHPECLLQKALVERLELRQAFAKARHGVWRKAFGNEQRDTAAVAMTARVTSRLVIIRRNKSICSALNAMPSGVTGSSANTRPNARSFSPFRGSRE